MTTHRFAIAAAFKELRSEGWFARMNFLCCQGCACVEAAQLLEEKGVDVDQADAVFFHRQDNESFGPDGRLERPLYLTHQGDTPRLVRALRAQGIEVEWDGDPDVRVKVVG